MTPTPTPFGAPTFTPTPTSTITPTPTTTPIGAPTFTPTPTPTLECPTTPTPQPTPTPIPIIFAKDITYNLSGGANNTDPNMSLGDEISNHPIILEKLFKNISPNERIEGKTDYRCFYIKNNSLTATLFQVQLYVYYKVPNDIEIFLGFDTKNERQIITIANNSPVLSGFITIEYMDMFDNVHSVSAYWNSSSSIFANNIKSVLNTISGLEDVAVNTINTQTFEINFLGKSARRYYKQLNVQSNLLSMTGPVNVIVNKSVSGGPINTTTDSIDVETTTPFNIFFKDYSPSYQIGNLLPQEYLPVWIKRVSPPNATATEIDGLTIRLIGSTVES